MKSDREDHYSPFLPCLLVFTMLIVASGIQTYLLVLEHQALKETKTQLEASASQNIQTSKDALGKLAEDVLKLSETNANAKRIVEEMQIRKNANADPATPNS